MSHPTGTYPRLLPTPDESIAGIGRALREGRVSCVYILKSCLDQVEEWESEVHAWVVLDRDGAIKQARTLDEELKSGKDRGPLHGIPIGVKDIIDVKGQPTACGAKRWADRVASDDADVVARLREAGAVIMGKTVTTPYAWIDPPITRNPWNLARTPGGSSSGSAAAVACGMCYGAIGTQTGGSITRPASYCGVAGMKPSDIFARSPGILPLAPSLDHVGPLARAIDDLRLIFDAMLEPVWTKMSQQETDFSSVNPPRLGRLRGFFDRRAEPSIRAAVELAVKALESQGAEISEIEDPIDFEQVIKDHRTVMAAEAATVHSDWLEESPDDYPIQIRNLVIEGRSLSALGYLRAKSLQSQAMVSISNWLGPEKHDALITPATIGTPPDPSMTGDPAFNSPWSFTGLPTVSFPIGQADDGVPVALQLIGQHMGDWQLLRTSTWCEQAIRTCRQ